MKRIYKTLSTILIVIFSTEFIFAAEVNLYTSRHYDTDDALYQEFTNETGIKVNVISGKGKALMQRIRSEGMNSPADVFITVDAANLWKLQKDGLFQTLSSKKIINTIPKNLRGPENQWVAIAKRARVIFYDPMKISKIQIRNLSYEDLSDSKWKGKIAIRSSNNVYNQSLVASLISNHGVEETENWAKQFVSNFSRKPQGNDRARIIAVANGETEIAIANSYYIGLMLSGKKGQKQKKAAEKVSMHFPSQSGRGTHINISGAGVLKNGPNSLNASKFIEFLISNKAQKHIIDNTYEYSVLSDVKPNQIMSQFGTDFKEDQTSVSEYGEFNPEAVRLMDRAGWK